MGGVTAMAPQKTSEEGFPTTSNEGDVVFARGVYELAFDAGTATVHVDHDVTADEIMPAMRELVGCMPRALAAAG